MATAPVLPPNRHIPYKKGGWGAAILTLAAAAGAFLTAFYIHTQTYRHPRDVMMRETYEQPTSGAASGEGHKSPEMEHAAPTTPAPETKH